MSQMMLHHDKVGDSAGNAHAVGYRKGYLKKKC